MSAFICHRTSGFILLLLFLTPLFANESAVSELTHQTVWLDELDLSLTQCGWKQTQANRSILEGPLVIGNRQFERGVGHHAPGSIVVELPEGNIRFSAEVGVNVDAESAIGDIRFLIYADNEPLWDSGIMTPGEAAKSIDLDLTGHQYVALVVTTGADDYAGDHADWCNAKFDWTPVASSNDSDRPAAPRIIKAMVAENGFIINEADRSSEVKREYFAIQQQLFTDVEKQRSNYYESRYGTGYNGSFQFMTPPPEETVASEAVHPDANVFDTDRDPLDVIIRRTRTLCDYLIENSDEDGFLKPESEALDRLEKTASEVPVDRTSERQKIFRDVFTLRRQIALSNPLLDFSDILFIKRFSCEPDENMGNHMCDQFFGFNALPGGGLFLLKDAFSDSPEAVDLLKDLPVSIGKYILRKKLEGKKLDSTWGFLSPELSFNADEILFAATDTKSPRHLFEWTNDNCYHIFKLKFDPETGKASDLVQLTEGAVNDFDPCFLPSGRIIFISERRGGYGRCHPRIVPSYTLFSMNPDGSDFVMLSPHETNEWQPVVDANGMVLYTRWDYVDRGANNAHHPWITAPDGRDPRAVTGNYNSWAFNRPVFEGNIRPVPGTGLMTATAAAHHGQVYGSLLLINPKIQDDNAMAPMRRITPEQLFPEAEMPQHAAPARYATCYPLSEYFYLCVYDPMARADTPSNSNNYGIYLLDAFGNRTLLYRDPAISCYDPIPVRKNPVPPIVPHQTLVGKPLAPGEEFTPIDSSQLPKMAEMAVMNVYDTTLPFPEGTKIKRLRIVQILPKTTWEADHPRIGYGDQKGARQVLGTVPVEEDGSAYFRIPVNIPVYFQALDEHGVAVQSMRSDTYVHEGERLFCQGCHENRHEAAEQPVQRNCLALRRDPSDLLPDPPGTKPMNYPLLIQPILDEKCVDCHAKSEDPKAIDLSRGPEGKHFFNSFENLKSYCFYYNHYLWTEPQTIPGQFGSFASPLYKILTSDHYGVQLTPEELYRFTVWMDNNCDFYGVYEECERQRNGELLTPTME